MRLFHSSKRYDHRSGSKTKHSLLSIYKVLPIGAICLLTIILFSVYKINRYTEVSPPSFTTINVRDTLSLKFKTLSLLSRKYNKETQPKSVNSSTSNANYITDNNQIITTVFWVGESSSGDNGFISNKQSAWDGSWQQHYGGIDDPYHRNGFLPAQFTPTENPFYVALPYNDIDQNDVRKSTANLCLNINKLANQDYSWCKNSWVKITHDSLTAYAQWEDVGPFEEDDVNYVFKQVLPTNKYGAKAGLDVSPAVKDYLKLQDLDYTSWSFVHESDVPNGPWKNIITRSLGYKM